MVRKSHEVVRYRIQVQGLVQGVGFRPFVWKLAAKHACTGWVRNEAWGVEIEAQGSLEEVRRFLEELSVQAPPQSIVASVFSQIIETTVDERGFQILESQNSQRPRTFVSPDLATCYDCLRELRDPQNRRFAYPFINCTNCGPRFTIQTAVPYDRKSTTMREFELCERCRAEYDSPSERRFHAEPNACPECGPAIWFQSNDASEPVVASQVAGELPFPSSLTRTRCSAEVLATIDQIRRYIAVGRIVAIKGIGGFHLACDATNPLAVRLLRQRKRRPFKPLAVMVADLKTASRIAHLSQESRGILESHQRPIVLMRKIAGALPEEVSPNNAYLGLLLPYSPLHHLLLRSGEIWVMTSGNLADEPIAYQNDDALERLRPLADAYLLHDRSIYTVCDDSVVRSCTLGMIPIRRSRGYAPLPVEIQSPKPHLGHWAAVLPQDSALRLDGGSSASVAENEPTILAVGGELKTSLCLLVGSQAFMGQHVGDMGHRETLDALERSRDHLLSLYHVQPDRIVADLHPGYISTAWAKQLAKDRKMPFVQVQHHHAHAAALIAEHGLPADQPIIACVLDGTGYGTDGAIWGGEILVASARSFRRVAHLEYLPLPGGDSAILQPAKTALAFLSACGLEWHSGLPSVQHFSKQNRKLLRQQLERKLHVVKTSSMGRLFDAVASVIGLRHQIDYEGQAGLELEAMAEQGFAAQSSIQAYPFEWSEDCVRQLRVSSMLREICRQVLEGVEPATLSARFHLTISDCLVSICQRLRDSHTEQAVKEWELKKVGLTGGVFQNAVLLELVHSKLIAAGFEVLIHHQVPPNDGGLALGQAIVARNQLPQQFK